MQKLINSKCDSPEKIRLHPLCTNVKEEREERIKKIKNFYKKFDTNVGNRPKKVNREYQNKYIEFVKKARSLPNNRWIFEHFDYEKKKKVMQMKIIQILIFIISHLIQNNKKHGDKKNILKH